MTIKKIEISVVLGIIAWLISAGVRAVQTDAKVDQHDQEIKSISAKVDQISNDTAFIRGKLETK